MNLDFILDARHEFCDEQQVVCCYDMDCVSPPKSPITSTQPIYCFENDISTSQDNRDRFIEADPARYLQDVSNRLDMWESEYIYEWQKWQEIVIEPQPASSLGVTIEYEAVASALGRDLNRIDSVEVAIDGKFSS